VSTLRGRPLHRVAQFRYRRVRIERFGRLHAAGQTIEPLVPRRFRRRLAL
jgi:hypothetical protein